MLSEEANQIAEGNTQFAVDLYTRLGSGKPGNLFFSPYSISAALAMTEAGAAGRTEQQMREVLHLNISDDKLHPAFKSLAGLLDASGQQNGCQLRVANRLWGRQEFQFLPPFLDTTRQTMAELAQLDFAGQPEAARATINGWVEKQTGNKIRICWPLASSTPIPG